VRLDARLGGDNVSGLRKVVGQHTLNETLPDTDRIT
jgi:hypothetical protein